MALDDPAAASEIPVGDDATVPDPTWVTVKDHVCTNVAVTDLIAFIVIVQVDDEPVHAPPQPVKVALEDAVAVRVTDVPLL